MLPASPNKKEHIIWQFSYIGEPHIDPQKLIILIIETPIMLPLILGNPLCWGLCFGTLQHSTAASSHTSIGVEPCSHAIP